MSGGLQTMANFVCTLYTHSKGRCHTLLPHTSAATSSQGAPALQDMDEAACRRRSGQPDVKLTGSKWSSFIWAHWFTMVLKNRKEWLLLGKAMNLLPKASACSHIKMIVNVDGTDQVTAWVTLLLDIKGALVQLLHDRLIMIIWADHSVQLLQLCQFTCFYADSLI